MAITWINNYKDDADSTKRYVPRLRTEDTKYENCSKMIEHIRQCTRDIEILMSMKETNEFLDASKISRNAEVPIVTTYRIISSLLLPQGLVEKREFKTGRTHTEYIITPKGIDFLDVYARDLVKAIEVMPECKRDMDIIVKKLIE